MAELPITDDLLPSLREWFDYNYGADCGVDQLQATLVEAGYRRADVEAFVRAHLAARPQAEAPFDADAVETAQAAVDRFWARSDLLCTFNRISLGDRVVSIQTKAPRQGLLFVTDFLSGEDCDALVAAVRARMADTAILDESAGRSVKSHTRSSQGAGLARGDGALVRRIESRIARLTSLPIAHGEGLQMLHYAVGGEYRPHFDYFDPATPGGARMLEGNSQRLATVILYLSDVEAGGGTQFPQLGLEFTPLKGAALMFASSGRDGAVMPSSLHAGGPVTSGEKWIATKWLWQTPQ